MTSCFPSNFIIDIENANIKKKSWCQVENEHEAITCEKKDKNMSKNEIDKLTKQTTTTISEMIHSFSPDYNDKRKSSIFLKTSKNDRSRTVNKNKVNDDDTNKMADIALQDSDGD